MVQSFFLTSPLFRRWWEISFLLCSPRFITNVINRDPNSSQFGSLPIYVTSALVWSTNVSLSHAW